MYWSVISRQTQICYRFYRPPPSNIPLHVTVSILRLAQKYQVPFLKRRAVVYLDYFFPVDQKRILKACTSKGSRFGDNDDLLETLCDALHLVHVHIPIIHWILPCIVFVIVSKFNQVDAIKQKPWYARLPSNPRDWIESDGTREAVNGIMLNQLIDRAGMSPQQGCLTSETCSELFTKLQSTIHNLPSSDQDPSRVSLENRKGLKFCSNCQGAILRYQKELEEKSKEVFWNQLSKACDRESWNDVLKSRNNYLEVLEIIQREVDALAVKFTY